MKSTQLCQGRLSTCVVPAVGYGRQRFSASAAEVGGVINARWGISHRARGVEAHRTAPGVCASATMSIGRRSARRAAEFEVRARRARLATPRVWVILHLFAGPRRAGDYQEQLEKLAKDDNIEVLVVSVDLWGDAKWDLGNDETFAGLMRLAEEGCVAVCGGGGPCSTTSRARHSKHPGPRPLRPRGDRFWAGIPGLLPR